MDTATIEDTLNDLGIKYASTFIPASHFDDDPWRSNAINHNVTVTRGRVSINTNYAQGIGHIPKDAIEGLPPKSIAYANRVKEIINSGRGRYKKRLPPPKLADVMFSLVMDGSGSIHDFEEWCSEYNLDSDSIKNKEAFEACRDTGLKLQTMFSADELELLQELFQDY